MINIRIILTLLTITLGLFLVMRIQGKLETKASPMGIVSLEFANSQERITEIKQAWTTEGMLERARTNIRIDYLFIPFYAMLFYTLCGTISVRMKRGWAKLGVLLAFGALVAGLLDAVENLLMLLALRDISSDFTAVLTSVLAGVKFLLLGLAALYVIPLGLRILLLKAIGKSPDPA
jgi:hypothetical protein